MKAMILAAGKGTRLQPLTNSIPKALIQIGNYTLLELIILHLKKFGITDVIINVSHFANQITDYLKSKNNFNINIHISDETDELLETGGGLKKARWFFEGEKDLLLIGGDSLTSLNLSDMINYHTKNKNNVTLAVKDRDTSRNLLFTKDYILTGWRNNQSGEQKIIRDYPVQFGYGFSVIQLINTEILDLLPVKDKFSIMEFYLDKENKFDIYGYEHNQDIWIEFGRYENLEKTMQSKELKDVIHFITH